MGYKMHICTQLGSNVERLLAPWKPCTTNSVYVQVVNDVAMVLEHMHGAGLVHRNVKPSHIVQHPRTQTWMLIDFSSTATAGQLVPLEYTLQYAAPESVKEMTVGGGSHLATTGLDAWSLGVVTYELLTGAPWAAQLDDNLVIPHIVAALNLTRRW
ncbi:MAG: protein kinase [Akkermansiaceae bacterium]|nr:protein kinase [Akkermansiaceae bacterium]